MKKLQKIKLNDASLMSESEMKKVIGSFQAGRSKDCPRGHSEIECAYSCEQDFTNEYGTTYFLTGSCHYIDGDICACIID